MPHPVKILLDKPTASPLIQDNKVQVFAPEWVKEALVSLSKRHKFTLAQFQSAPSSTSSSNSGEQNLSHPLSLQDLVAIARNEISNVTGVIDFTLYPNVEPEVVYALKDLVKHCVIVGKDFAPTYGGYPRNNPIKPLNKSVYVIDLPGLQFQESYNSGRLVLVTKDGSLPKGHLDEMIYLKTVGEPKPSYANALKNPGRFVKATFQGKKVLFDSLAFHSFVAQDFLLAARALNEQARSINPEDTLNFKFLAYGTGFFADSLGGLAKETLKEELTIGVLKGLKLLTELPIEQRNQIKRIELPFYSEPNNLTLDYILKEIKEHCEAHQLEFSCANEDALEQTSPFITATTNCSDPHAPTRNEGNYLSVDAAIGENLQHKAKTFNPVLNKQIQASYLSISHLPLPYAEIKRLTFPYWKELFAATIFFCGNTLVQLSLFSRIGAGLLLVAGFALANRLITKRKEFMRDQYKAYKSKSDQGVSQLTQSQKKAFEYGCSTRFALEEGDWLTGTRHSLFSYDAWRSPKAYYAGMQASKVRDGALYRKLKRSAP